MPTAVPAVLVSPLPAAPTLADGTGLSQALLRSSRVVPHESSLMSRHRRRWRSHPARACPPTRPGGVPQPGAAPPAGEGWRRDLRAHPAPVACGSDLGCAAAASLGSVTSLVFAATLILGRPTAALMVLLAAAVGAACYASRLS